MTYDQRANSILKDAIKSAIYIDEKAKPFYQLESDPKNNIEEQLSVDLYTNFKENGISLEVHKFKPTDLGNQNILNFITDNRDFVILDWKLDGDVGEDYSLKLLNNIIEAKHINFCTIYTSIDTLDEVLMNILSYFSGKTDKYYDEIKEILESEEFDKDIIEIFHDINLNRTNSEHVRKLRGQLYQKDRSILVRIKEITKEIDDTCAIIRSSIALSNTYKSNIELCCPSFVNPTKKIVVINNTIITILNKGQNDANSLLNNFKEHIINDIDSFNQLLGIELYNSLFRNSVIVNDDIMSFSKDALIHHRNKLKEEDLGYFFKSFMDEILLEKIAMSIRDRVSILLDDQFLDTLGNEESKINEIELQKMNVFYNSLVLDKKNKILNFGDVFKIDGEEKYLMCITPLCDCLRPQPKTKSNFYFVEGGNISLSEALSLGDTAFISYLNDNTNIKWTNKNSNEYGPLYIKPWQYKILEGQNLINSDNKITVYYLNREGQIKNKVLSYIGTIRPNYTQRIANHAFSHPVRVGVDFVKI